MEGKRVTLVCAPAVALPAGRAHSKCCCAALVLADHRERLYPGPHVPRDPPAPEVAGAQQSARGEPSPQCPLCLLHGESCLPHFQVIVFRSVKVRLSLCGRQLCDSQGLETGAWQLYPAARALTGEAEEYCSTIRAEVTPP